MKKERKNKERKYFDVINDIKILFESNDNSIPNEKKKDIELLLEESHKLRLKELKDEKELKIFGPFLMIIILFFGGFFLLTLYNNVNLENDIIDKTNIINKLKVDNDILNIYLRGESYKGLKDNKYVTTYSPAYGDKGQVLKYEDLKKVNDSLSKVVHSQKMKLYDNEIKIVEAQSNYDITNHELEIIKKSFGIYFTPDKLVISPKIDSALILYPVFKNRLKFDKEKNHWYISSK